jgi:hypothetical protein
MSLLKEALTYLDMGWAVYPSHAVDLETGLCTCGSKDCPCPGKHPVGQWREYQNRLPNKDEVRSWFSSLDCNIGTLTGQVSGIAVVDVDGEKGLASLKTLDLAPTLMARTGGGGLHMFYQISGPVPSRVKAYDGIDIRGDGAYVVLSPSIHRSGKMYKWLRPRLMAEFDPEPFERKGSANGNEEGWYSGLLQGVAQGSRNISAARLAGRYANVGLSLEEAFVLLLAWNERNDPPLDLSELKRTLKAIYRKHSENNTVQIETLGQIRKLLNKE